MVDFLIKMRGAAITRNDSSLWNMRGPYAGNTRAEFMKELNASRPVLLSNLDYLINYDENDLYGPENRKVIMSEISGTELANNPAFKEGDQLVSVFITRF